MNILVSPFLHRYFEVPVVDFLLEVFGYGAHDGERAPEEDVESARNTADRSAWVPEYLTDRSAWVCAESVAE